MPSRRAAAMPCGCGLGRRPRPGFLLSRGRRGGGHGAGLRPPSVAMILLVSRPLRGCSPHSQKRLQGARRDARLFALPGGAALAPPALPRPAPGPAPAGAGRAPRAPRAWSAATQGPASFGWDVAGLERSVCAPRDWVGTPRGLSEAFARRGIQMGRRGPWDPGRLRCGLGRPDRLVPLHLHGETYTDLRARSVGQDAWRKLRKRMLRQTSWLWCDCRLTQLYMSINAEAISSALVRPSLIAYAVQIVAMGRRASPIARSARVVTACRTGIVYRICGTGCRDMLRGHGLRRNQASQTMGSRQRQG